MLLYRVVRCLATIMSSSSWTLRGKLLYCCIQFDKLVSQETSFNESSWSRDLFLVIKYLRIEHFYFLTLRKGLGVVSDDILPCRL